MANGSLVYMQSPERLSVTFEPVTFKIPKVLFDHILSRRDFGL